MTRFKCCHSNRIPTAGAARSCGRRQPGQPGAARPDPSHNLDDLDDAHHGAAHHADHLGHPAHLQPGRRRPGRHHSPASLHHEHGRAAGRAAAGRAAAGRAAHDRSGNVHKMILHRKILINLGVYRVSHLRMDLGWVDFDLCVPPRDERDGASSSWQY